MGHNWGRGVICQFLGNGTGNEDMGMDVEL